jgi:manganese transport protein
MRRTTVMPHALYLHSGLSQGRLPYADASRRRALVISNNEVLAAVGFAGLVNMAMITSAAAASDDASRNQTAEIGTAYRTPGVERGGVMAGQLMMQGFVSFHIPLWLRRLVVMGSSLIDSTRALVLSQVVLSLVLPLPLVALVRFTASRTVMGEFANSRLTNAAALAGTAFVCALNGMLILSIAGAMLRPG